MRKAETHALRVSTNNAKTRISIQHLGEEPGNLKHWYEFQLSPQEAINFAKRLIDRAEEIETLGRKRETNVVLGGDKQW